MGLLRLDWIDRDGKFIIAAMAVRGFAVGVAAGSVPTYVKTLDLNSNWVGGVSILALLVVFLLAILVILFAEKIGRRRLTVGFTLGAAAAAATLALSPGYLVALALVSIGVLGYSGRGGIIEYVPLLERAAIVDTVPPHRRTDLLAVYSIVAAVVAGAAGLLGILAILELTLISALFGFMEAYYLKVVLLMFAALLLVSALLYRRVSPQVEVPLEARRWTNPFTLPSRRIIFALVGLFSLESISMTLIVTYMLSLRFTDTFGGVNLLSLGVFLLIFSIIGVPFPWLGAKIANRIGLINTIVLAHIPAAILLAAAMFVPSSSLTVLLWQLHGLLRNMAQPARASYLMGVVEPQERVAVNGMSFLANWFTMSFGFPFMGYLLDTGVHNMAAGLAIGLLLSNAAFVTLMYRLFRNVKPPEEMERQASDTG